MSKIVGSATKAKKHHKRAVQRIVQEAIRLNGSARSNKGRDALIRFADKKCGIVISPLVLDQILRGQNGNGAHAVVSKPACKTRSARCVSRNTF